MIIFLTEWIVHKLHVHLSPCWGICVVLWIWVTWHKVDKTRIIFWMYFQKSSSVAAWATMIDSTRGLKIQDELSEHLSCKKEAWQAPAQLIFHSVILPTKTSKVLSILFFSFTKLNVCILLKQTCILKKKKCFHLTKELKTICLYNHIQNKMQTR